MRLALPFLGVRVGALDGIYIRGRVELPPAAHLGCG